MTSMNDFSKVEITGDAVTINSELHMEKNIQNTVSLASKNVEKVMGLETDMLDDIMYESRMKITNNVPDKIFENLPLEFQYVPNSRVELNYQYTSNELFHCYICGQTFDLNHLLKTHLAEHKKQKKKNTHACKICGKRFLFIFGLKKHIHNIHNHLCECGICSTKYNSKKKYKKHLKSHEISKTRSDVIPNIERCKLSNVTERKKSDQTNCINSNVSTVHIAPHNLNGNNTSLDLIKEKTECSAVEKIVTSYNTDLANSNGSIIQNTPCHLLTNNSSLHLKQNKILLSIEKNSSDQMDLANSNELIVSNASHNSIVNSFQVPNITQEKNFCTNVEERKSSDQMDLVNSNESTVSNQSHILMTEQSPTNIGSNYVELAERETPYFCIRKLPNIKNIFSNGINEQTPQNNLIFICRICKKSPSTDIHSFALHMSEHVECSMHECVVCDISFKTLLLWVNHMLEHQQQIDLQLSTVQFNPIDTESNKNIRSRSSSTTFTNEKIKKITLDDSHAEITDLNNSATKIKNQYYCNTSKKVLPTKNTLKAHELLQNKSDQFFCNYVDEVVSGIGHSTNNESCQESILQNNENNKLKAIVVQNDISIEDDSNCSEIISTSHKKIIKGTTFCNLCNQNFTKRQFTNHKLLKHNINPNASKQLTTINADFKKKHVINNEIKIQHKSNSKSKQQINNPKSNIEFVRNQDKFKCRCCKKEYNLISQWKKHITISKECGRYCKSYLPEFTSNQGTDEFFYQTEHMKNVHKKLDSTNLNTNKNKVLQKNRLMVKVQGKPVITKYTKSNHINSTKCKVCGKIFSTSSNLNRHISNIHKKMYKPLTSKVTCREYLSTDPNESFKNYKEINNTNNRTNIIEYFCKICKIEFADNIALLKHSKTHKIYKCGDCAQQFESNIILGKHILEKHNTNITTKMNKYVKNNKRLSGFVDKINNNPNQCTICLKVFISPEYLNRHLRSHAGVKP